MIVGMAVATTVISTAAMKRLNMTPRVTAVRRLRDIAFRSYNEVISIRVPVKNIEVTPPSPSCQRFLTLCINGIGLTSLKQDIPEEFGLRPLHLDTAIGMSFYVPKGKREKMANEDKVYRALQRHLHRQPVGFPATKSGSDLRLLKRLFTPDEAQLALNLNYKPRSAKDIYEDLRGMGTSLEGLTDALEGMAGKSSIGHVERDGVSYFFAIPLVVGMYEGQLYGLSREFLKNFDEYTNSRAFGLEFLSSELPQMRTIPVQKSIPVQHHVATYDQLANLIHESYGPFVMNECICRKVADLNGSPCQKTTRLETCMALGDIARNCIRAGKGREVTKEEALEISRQSEEEGLIFQPSNSQKAEFICACCGCCCGMLRLHKALPRPVDFWASNYHASVDAEACAGCETCVERCQVGAVTVEDKLGVAMVDLARCIGCGNCVSSCPSGAMSLVKKEKEVAPPETREDLYEVIMRHKKGVPGKVRLAAKLMLQSVGARGSTKR
jgi:electron transport complex protein RnfB